MIHHHPSDATLIAAAAGTLPVLHSQVLAVHLAQCPICRATLRLGEELGGALLDAEPPMPLTENGLAQTLGRLDAPVPPAFAARDLVTMVPTSLETLSRGRHWRRLGLGVQLIPLVPRDRTGTRLDLIRVAPGNGLPQHEHSGPEMTCVLRGSFTDGTGEYHVGDVAEGDVGLDHKPRTFGDEACICIVATTGYLRAHSLIARLLQPIFDI